MQLSNLIGWIRLSNLVCQCHPGSYITSPLVGFTVWSLLGTIVHGSLMRLTSCHFRLESAAYGQNCSQPWWSITCIYVHLWLMGIVRFHFFLHLLSLSAFLSLSISYKPVAIFLVSLCHCWT